MRDKELREKLHRSGILKYDSKFNECLSVEHPISDIQCLRRQNADNTEKLNLLFEYLNLEVKETKEVPAKKFLTKKSKVKKVLKTEYFGNTFK